MLWFWRETRQHYAVWLRMHKAVHAFVHECHCTDCVVESDGRLCIGTVHKLSRHLYYHSCKLKSIVTRLQEVWTSWSLGQAKELRDWHTHTQKTDISGTRQNHAEFDRIYKTGRMLCKYSQQNINYVHGTECTVDVNPRAGDMYIIQRKSPDKPLTSFIRDRIQRRNNGSAIHPNAADPTVIKTNYSNIESGLERLFYHQPEKQMSFVDARLCHNIVHLPKTRE